MKHPERFFCILALLLAGTVSAFAQASSTTAELRGQVIAPSGTAVSDAKVTLIDTAKEASH